MSVKRKIAVIGTGWSGLSAAVNLAGKADVTVFEAGKTAGGRARALAADNAGFSFLDNGQHIMMYAYRGVRHLMDKIGADYRCNGIWPTDCSFRRPLCLRLFIFYGVC